jgi:hypothetical protein
MEIELRRARIRVLQEEEEQLREEQARQRAAVARERARQRAEMDTIAKGYTRGRRREMEERWEQTTAVRPVDESGGERTSVGSRGVEGATETGETSSEGEGARVGSREGEEEEESSGSASGGAAPTVPPVSDRLGRTGERCDRIRLGQAGIVQQREEELRRMVQYYPGREPGEVGHGTREVELLPPRPAVEGKKGRGTGSRAGRRRGVGSSIAF